MVNDGDHPPYQLPHLTLNSLSSCLASVSHLLGGGEGQDDKAAEALKAGVLWSAHIHPREHPGWLEESLGHFGSCRFV